MNTKTSGVKGTAGVNFSPLAMETSIVIPTDILEIGFVFSIGR